MWMVDTNCNNDHTKIPIDGRKLRPLMPRPNTKINLTPYSNPSCSCIRNPNILHWTHPISGLCDYGVRREVPLVSTRWNPTPEQLQALEEMYKRGIRTPSAEQIQQIASKLRRFGKIEGKNVFYWFQNHKARERQKKRRQLELHLTANKIPHPHDHTLDTKQTPAAAAAGLSRRYIEIEHHKKLATASASKCTSTEDTASMQAPAVIATDDHIVWPHNIHNQPSSQFLHSLSPNKSQYTMPLPDTKENHPTTTLQLFPIRDSVDSFASRDETKFGPSEFIEFLPTKNFN